MNTDGLKIYANSIIRGIQEIELKKEYEDYNDLLDGIYSDCEELQKIIGENYAI